MADDVTVARLVLAGYSKTDAEAIASKLDGEPAPTGTPAAGSAETPPALEAAAADPENQAAIEATRTAGDPVADARAFLALSATEMAALPREEFQRGFAAAKSAGLL